MPAGSPCLALLLLTTAAADLTIFLRPMRSMQRTELQKESGCSLEWREVEYEWTIEWPDPAPTIPQLVQFRVDCRDPDAELTALEVWDKHKNCGRVSYTKYLSLGDQSHGGAETVKETSQGPKVVVRSGDVIDFHCVLSPMRLDEIVVEHLDEDAELSVQWQATFAFNVKLSKSDISVSGVEVYKVSLPLVATAEKIKEQLDLVLLREACRDALKTAYDWKLVLSKSTANRHRIKFQSPQLGANYTRLEEFDDPNMTLKEMGAASFANGLQLAGKVTHAKCENIAEGSLIELLSVSPVEWADQGPSDHAVALDLTAEVATLPQGTKELQVTLEAFLWGMERGASSGVLKLPVVNAGTKRFLSSPRVFWIQVITVTCFLLLGLAYYYYWNRPARRAPVRSQRATRTEEVELQRPSETKPRRTLET